MKIAFVINEMTGGGAERVISVLANHMVEQNIEVDILLTSGNRVEYELSPEIKVTQVGVRTCGNPINLVRRIDGLRRAFKKNNYDAIIAFAADTGLYALVANCFLGNRLFMSERCDPASYNHKILMWIAYFGARRVVFQTEDARNYFTGKIKDRGIVIPNPISASLPEPYDSVRTKEIVAVGRLEPQKNYDLLIDSFDIFHKEHPEYTLHIFGKGYLERTIRDKCTEMSLNDSVVLEGFCDDVASRIKSAAMFVMSSDFEGMPNALMEAMALGIPSISTDCPIGGPKEIIENGVNGLLVKCNDVEELAGAMSKLAEDSELAAKIGADAIDIRTKYDVHSIYEKWIKAIS